MLWISNEMVRDAIILAGGLGTRMLPASLFSPKEALPLIDTPLINHLIWEASRAGVSKIHLILSLEKKRLLQEFLEGRQIHGPEVRDDLPRESLTLGHDGVEVIPYVQKNAGGVADAISVAIDQVDGPFLVLLGDMVIIGDHYGPSQSGPKFASEASVKLVSNFQQSGVPVVGVSPVKESEVEKYGVVEVTEEKILRIVEKPSVSDAPSNLVLCGRYLFPENTASILEKFPLSEYGEMQSIFLLNYLIENGGVNAVNLEGMEMYDSGDPMSWLKSQIDHGLRREDTSRELLEWLTDRLSRI